MRALTIMILSVIAVWLAAVILGVWVLSKPALGHGHYDWVMMGDGTAWCCGEEDCAPMRILPGRSVQRALNGGYVVTTAEGQWLFPEVGQKSGPELGNMERTYYSVDGDYHICFYDADTKQRPRCLFVPALGA